MSSLIPAASVLLARISAPHEIYLVRRADSLRSFGGFFAFPGGKVEQEDAQLSIEGTITDVPRGSLVGAARELFEETGILLARTRDGGYLTSTPQIEEFRQQLLGGKLSFARLLTQLGLRIFAGDFTPLGTLTTPPFAPVRFETFFFLATLPSGQEPNVWAGELAEGLWLKPADMIEHWRQGRYLLSPPTMLMLEALAGHPLSAAAPRLANLWSSHAATPLPPLFFAPHVRSLPLRCHSLPPMTHTSAFLIGADPCYLIDPGTTYPEEQELLFHVLDQHLAAGGRLTAVVLTHHHPDHIGAVSAVVERYKVPVYAHVETAKLLEGEIAVQRTIADGEHLTLGRTPSGSGDWYLEAIHTPGHAPGHLAFYESYYRFLFAGDMVSTITSIVIAPPEGDLSTYLQSLERLRAYEMRLLLPSHGNVTSQGRRLIDDCIAHRLKREQQLLATLGKQHQNVEELTRQLYRGLPPEMLRFAHWQVLAGLRKLQSERRVAMDDHERWYVC